MHQAYFTACMENADAINSAIIFEFKQAMNAGRFTGTHHFSGRYENLYIDRCYVPSLEPVLDRARELGADYLHCPQRRLVQGFWFNCMEPGHVTLPHNHDEDDERLSGVYYLSVPAGSGDLRLHTGDSITRVQPLAGHYVFFAPDLVHEVSENRSRDVRLSIGLNMGVA